MGKEMIGVILAILIVLGVFSPFIAITSIVLLVKRFYRKLREEEASVS